MAADQRTPNPSVVKNSETENGSNGAGNRKAVSLKCELQDLERGLAALRRLINIALEMPRPEVIPESDTVPEFEEIQAILAEVSALLGFINCRIFLIRRMVEGEINPFALWTLWNDAGVYWNEPDNTDVVFTEWTISQRVIHARLELDRAELKTGRGSET